MIRIKPNFTLGNIGHCGKVLWKRRIWIFYLVLAEPVVWGGPAPRHPIINLVHSAWVFNWFGNNFSIQIW